MYEKWFRSFHAVAQAGSFTRAAEKLGVGQPTLTEQVKSLEKTFGVELFYRRGRTIGLTETGMGLFEITREAFGQLNEAVRYLEATARGPGGPFVVGSISPYGVMELVKEFGHQMPTMNTTVHVADRNEIMAGLMEFRISVALIGRRVDDARLASILYRPFPVSILVPGSHPWAKRKSIRIEELEGAEMILRERRSTTRGAFERALQEAGVTTRTVMEIDSREAIREAVALGMGFGIISGIRGPLGPDLAAIRVSDADMVTESHIACLRSRINSPPIAKFLEIARELEPAGPVG